VVERRHGTMQGRPGNVGAAGKPARRRCRSLDLGGAVGGNSMLLVTRPAPCLAQLPCREPSVGTPKRGHEQLIERGPDADDRRLNRAERDARLGIFALV
jgi:hypothetical protein